MSVNVLYSNPNATGLFVNTFSEQTNINGNKTFNNNVTIKGNLNVNGSTSETHTEQFYTKKNYIILREGAKADSTGALTEINATNITNNTVTITGTTDGHFGGLAFTNYDGKSTGYIVIDKKGILRVGDGDTSTPLQPLLTRAESGTLGLSASNRVLLWDNSKLRAIGHSSTVGSSTDYTPVYVNSGVLTALDMKMASNSDIDNDVFK